MVNRHRTTILAATMVATASLSVPVFADETGENSLSLTGSVGYSWITGNELVYNNNGEQISKLIWDTNTPVLGVNFAARFMGHYTIDANVDFAVGANNNMVDFDWLAPFRAGFGPDQWTDRSIHPDTDLEKYINFGFAFGRDFTLANASVVNVHGGFKYRDIKWNAKGGSFVYSTNGLRDDRGNFTPGSAGISYQQTLPTLFVGVSGNFDNGPWSVKSQLRGGAAVKAKDQDHHFARDLLFDETYGPMPYIAAGIDISYSVKSNIKIFAGAEFEHYFRTKGDTTISSISTGAFQGFFADGAGMDFTSMGVKTGVSVSF